MPARIVVVHDDPDFVQPTVAALLAVGHDVKVFPDTMSAITPLEAEQSVELLITGVEFPAGQPNGVAFARMARVKRPGVQVLFAASPEFREHTEGVGILLPVPTSSAEVVDAVSKMLSTGRPAV